MNNIILKTKPIESAHKLYSLLSDIQSRTKLNPQQQQALIQDIRIVQEIISTIDGAESTDDWRSVWRNFLEVKRNFGGYVGNELGQKLTWLTETLLQDIFDSYTEVNKSHQV
jgi:hypothetical protein